MIYIESRIELIEGQKTNVNNSLINNSKNNVSCDFDGIRGLINECEDVCIIGSNILNDDIKMLDTSNVYIGNEISNANGLFTNQYIIEIRSSYDYQICFNTKIDAQPLEYITYIGTTPTTNTNTNHDAILNFDKRITKIQINSLTKANYPLIISGIFCGLDLVIDRKNILEFNGNTSSLEYNDRPCSGIVGNSSYIVFTDYNKKIEFYIKNNLISNGKKVNNILKNSLYNNSKPINEMYISSINYDPNDRSVTIDFDDMIKDMQNYTINRIDLKSEQYMIEVYKKLYYLTPSKFKFLDYINLPNDIKDELYEVKCKYPYIEKQSLYSAWDNFAKSMGYSIYINNNGNFTISKV